MKEFEIIMVIFTTLGLLCLGFIYACLSDIRFELSLTRELLIDDDKDETTKSGEGLFQQTTSTITKEWFAPTEVCCICKKNAKEFAFDEDDTAWCFDCIKNWETNNKQQWEDGKPL